MSKLSEMQKELDNLNIKFKRASSTPKVFLILILLKQFMDICTSQSLFNCSVWFLEFRS